MNEPIKSDRWLDALNMSLAFDADKAWSSERYDSVDWWRLDIHDLGLEPRLI